MNIINKCVLAILLAFENFTLAYLFEIALAIRCLPILNTHYNLIIILERKLQSHRALCGEKV